MKPAVVRLGLALLLFAGWLGWLLYLAVTASRPVVLSRPQLLVSNLDVIAEVPSLEGNPPTVTVKSVHWPKDDDWADALKGRTIAVDNLARCKDDWKGPGEYILPLTTDRKTFHVTPLPRSPGFPGANPAAERPRIYPVTPQTIQQLGTIAKTATVAPELEPAGKGKPSTSPPP